MAKKVGEGFKWSTRIDGLMFNQKFVAKKGYGTIHQSVALTGKKI